MNLLYKLKLNFYHKVAILLIVLSIVADVVYPQLIVATAQASWLPQEQNQLNLPEASDREPRKVVNTVVTVYSSTPDQTDDTPFLAANGPVHDGMIAANWLPFGTQVRFPELYGDKIFTVGDRMNAKYGYGRVDIWQDAPRAELLKFGVKRLKMEIY